jgi:hypothetical protein
MKLENKIIKERQERLIKGISQYLGILGITSICSGNYLEKYILYEDILLGTSVLMGGVVGGIYTYIRRDYITNRDREE